MRALRSSDLLRLRDRGGSLHPIDRALLTIVAADPERDGKELARLPLGERDALLLEVRGATLGDRVDAHAPCPACGEHVEVELSCSALAGRERPALGPWTLEHDDLRLTLRTLDSRDAAAAAEAGASGGAEAARRALLERAVASAERAGTPLVPTELTRELEAAVAESLESHDPRAELLLDIRCPACAHRWQPVLDVASFVWRELAARAQALMHEVHVLARTYGWSEGEILALSEPRRAAYLGMASG